MVNYKQICEAVSLYANSDINDTKAVNKIVYDITAIRKNKNDWTLTLNAHRLDGSGMPFSNTQVISNLNMVKKLKQIGGVMDHYHVFLRPGYINDFGDIVYTGEEIGYDIGKEATA